MGKCRVWHARGGPPPPGIADLGPDVWRGDREPYECGVKVLGAPVGSLQFVESNCQERMEQE